MKDYKVDGVMAMVSKVVPSNIDMAREIATICANIAGLFETKFMNGIQNFMDGFLVKLLYKR